MADELVNMEPDARRERYRAALWEFLDGDLQAVLLERAAEAVIAVADAETTRLREELRKAKRAANLLAADHRAVERVQRRLDAWEQRLPDNVRKDTVIDVLRHDLDDVA
jgi:uncharacterized membrane protein YccC